MEKRVTIKDVADKVGVSPGTVSRVLGQKPTTLISAKTQKAIIKAAHELNYSPNRVAQALVTGRTKMIAIISYTIRTSFYSTIIYRLNEMIRRDGYDTKLIFAEEDTVNCQLGELFVDGFILLNTYDFLSDEVKKYVLNYKPTVCVGEQICEDHSYVTFKTKENYTKLLKHLYEIGKRKIIVYPETPNIKKAYDEFVAEKKLESLYFENYLDNNNFLEIDFVYKNVMKYIEKKGLTFDAVLCVNDRPALGVIRALNDLNISIPDQVAVTGYDASPESNFYTPRLTTIKRPTDKIAYNAWRILRERLKNKDLQPEHLTLDSYLEIRESTVNKN